MHQAVKLHVSVVLKHILGREPKLSGPDEQDSEDSDDSEEEKEKAEAEERAAGGRSADLELEGADHGGFAMMNGRRASLDAFERKLRQQGALAETRKAKRLAQQRANPVKTHPKGEGKKNSQGFDISKNDLLDLNGPKLMLGYESWIVFYQIVGQMNWSGKPLYLSIIYKLLVGLFVLHRFFTRFIVKVTDLHVVNENYKNPIFLFIAFLTVITLAAHVLVTLRTNLLDLCPLYKILTTPKLCFLREEVLHVLGTDALGPMMIIHIILGLALSMLLSKNLEEFITDFRFVDVLLDIFCSTVATYWGIGLTHADLYIRLCFGHWLLALKSHLEQRFTLLHKHQRRKQRLAARLVAAAATSVASPALSQQQQQANASCVQPNNGDLVRRHSSGFTEATMDFNGSRNNSLVNHNQERPRKQLRLVTFDEIQTSLNNMDDHLEVLRTVQAGSLVLLTLEVFLINGMVFLITYHLLADQKNFYHGFLFLAISFQFIVIFFFCYFGDSWLYYALSAFVQTVEDEYFMQSDIKLGGSSGSFSQQQQQMQQWPPPPTQSNSSSIERELTPEPAELLAQQQMLLITKKDVLFCREFLHQFENHLATPWSNLTFKSHLHTLRTFVTLIAAQIIFEHEH